MKDIDWYTLSFDHKGRWQQKIDSIMNPGSKVTWPQFIVEMIIYLRSQVIKDYSDIRPGPGWSSQIQKHVRNLNQQAYVLCNYFPHPDDEPLIIPAFKNFFRRAKPLKIGQFRKVRFSIKNGKKILNITQDEKDVVLGIHSELIKLFDQRNIFAAAAPVTISKKAEDITFNTSSNKKNSKSLASIIALEKKHNGSKN